MTYPKGSMIRINRCGLAILNPSLHSEMSQNEEYHPTYLGDLLLMFAYGVGILPLIRILKQELPEVEHPWYADDSGAGGKFDAIQHLFLELQEIGPTYGNFPEPLKSVLILVVPSHSLATGRTAFTDLKFKIVTGNRYLGSFIGKIMAFDTWIQEKTKDWLEAVTELAVVAKNFTKSLQQEWQFVQRVKEDIGDKFA
jgi:hypothetical protein